MALVCLLGCGTHAQAQYGPWAYPGWWNHCATADEAYLTGWSRVFQAWGEANYLNSLAACGYQQAALMGLENRGRFLSPYTAQVAMSSVGPAMVAYQPALAAAPSAQSPAPLESGGRVLPHAAPPESQVVYLSPHVGRRAAESKARLAHYDQNFRDQARRLSDAQLAAQALAARLEASGGIIIWPPILQQRAYRPLVIVIEQALADWSHSSSLSPPTRSQLKRSLHALQRDLARRQWNESDDQIAEARSLLSQVETLTLGNAVPTGQLAGAIHHPTTPTETDR